MHRSRFAQAQQALSTLGLGLGLGLTACPAPTSPAPTGPDPDVDAGPVLLELVSGGRQQAPAGEALLEPVVVRALLGGEPAGGVEVRFSVATGALARASARTTASGEASPGTWRLGTSAGPQTLIAEADGADALLVIASATAGAPTEVAAHEGDEQSAPAGAEVSIAPAMRATDVHGNPVADLEVEFVVQSGGGVAEGAATTTDEDGVARVGRWILGASPGENLLEALSPGLPRVVFRATGVAAGEPYALLYEGDLQTGVIDAALPLAPAVRVFGAGGEPAAGVAVTFAIASGGGSVEGANAVTGTDGVARPTSWILGPLPGEQTLTADPEGPIPPLTFRATALATGEPELEVTVVVDALSRPWDLAFAPDGALVFTLRSGDIRVLRPGAAEHELLHRPADVVAQSQSGMLGVALDPDFADPASRYLYAYFSSNAGGTADNRVARFRVAADWSGLSEREDLVTGITYAGGGHSGGRLRFGPDGYLYATTGDTRQSHVPQDPTELGSKVLRIAKDGAIPAGNMAAPYEPQIWAYGFRNPQGITFRPDSGEAFLCEHGPGSDDEVTRLEPGGNGGWDPVNPDNPNDPTYWGYNGTGMTDLDKFPDALPPTFIDRNSGGMSGCDFLEGPAWRDWDGALAVGSLGDRNVRILRLSEDGRSLTADVTTLFAGQDRIRAVEHGPDGAMYLLTDGANPDQIRRVAPR